MKGAITTIMVAIIIMMVCCGCEHKAKTLNVTGDWCMVAITTPRGTITLQEAPDMAMLFRFRRDSTMVLASTQLPAPLYGTYHVSADSVIDFHSHGKEQFTAKVEKLTDNSLILNINEINVEIFLEKVDNNPKK